MIEIGPNLMHTIMGIVITIGLIIGWIGFLWAIDRS
jgi:nitrogen fixation-related uncharacterized protein